MDADDYLCMTILGRPGEGEPEFKGRLSDFWTALLRSSPEQFEKVYAEAAAFEVESDRLARRYLVEADVATSISAALGQSGLQHRPLDFDDLYSKYEAAPPEWFWIEH